MTLSPLRPDFALSLSFDGIRLVQRAQTDWLSLGDVPLDTPDLRAALAELRFRAEALAGEPVITKLVIPNDQIRYLTLDLSGEDARADDAAVANALEGQTPYPVEDLAYDWCLLDGKVQVAAVTQQTLSEAKAFASDHNFFPASYVATPPDGAFEGEVFFGAVDPNQPIDRDTQPIRVVGVVGPATQPELIPDPELEPEALAAHKAATQPVDDSPAPMAEDVVEDAIESPQSAALESHTAADESASYAAEPSDADPQPVFRRSQTAAPEPAPAPTASPNDAEPIKRDGAPKITLTKVSPVVVKTHKADAPQDPADPPKNPEVAANADPAAPAPVTEDTKTSQEAQAPTFSAARAARAARLAAVDLSDPDLETFAPPISATPAKEDPVAPKGGFASIRAWRGDKSSAAPRVTPTLDSPAKIDGSVSAPVIPIEQPEGQSALAALASAARSEVPATTATTIALDDAPASAVAKGAGFFSRGLRAAANAVPGIGEPKLATAAAASLPAPSQSLPQADDERQRMTVFGAREDQRVGGKPKYLGLVLTILLLICLLGVAAMAAVFVDERITRFFSPQIEAPTAAELAEDDIPLILPSDVPSAEEPVTLASLGGTTSSDAGPTQPGVIEALSRPEPLPQLSFDEATTQYAVTGIWQLAPDVPNQPRLVPLGELYFPTLDPDIKQLDAVALPVAQDGQTDIAPGQFRSPAPAGTEFDLDERGFVRATPEGALTPDGIRVFSGRPVLVPPLRDPATIPEPSVEIDPDVAKEQERLAKLRPKLRPKDLAENNERAELNGRTREELAKLRPKLRPTSVQELAEAARQAEIDKALAKVKEEEAAEAAKQAAIDAAIAEADAAEKKAEAEKPKEEEPAAKIVGTAQAVAKSREPKTRPRNFARIVARAQRVEKEQEKTTRVVAQVKPKTVKPAAPSKSSVTRNATVKNAIKLNRINLIGVYGKPSSRRALVRMKNGRYKKVKVGDRIDGGRISAIGDGVLKYTKNGRSVTLKLPKT